MRAHTTVHNIIIVARVRECTSCTANSTGTGDKVLFLGRRRHRTANTHRQTHTHATCDNDVGRLSLVAIAPPPPPRQRARAHQALEIGGPDTHASHSPVRSVDRPQRSTELECTYSFVHYSVGRYIEDSCCTLSHRVVSYQYKHTQFCLTIAT